MSDYNTQYGQEEALFGEPYPVFAEFVMTHAVPGGRALDLGCGQGRDALMLARCGYQVTAVDAAEVGVTQMLAQAEAFNLPIVGIVADLYDYMPTFPYDAIVLDSILHFQKNDQEKERRLLDKTVSWLNPGGYLFLFIHKSPKKEKQLQRWTAEQVSQLRTVAEGYVDYTYREAKSGFTSSFQYFMLVLQRAAPGGVDHAES